MWAAWPSQLGDIGSFQQVVYSPLTWDKERLMSRRNLKWAKWLWSFQISLLDKGNFFLEDIKKLHQICSPVKSWAGPALNNVTWQTAGLYVQPLHFLLTLCTGKFQRGKFLLSTQLLFLCLSFYFFVHLLTWSPVISHSYCQQRCQFSLTNHTSNTFDLALYHLVMMSSLVFFAAVGRAENITV